MIDASNEDGFWHAAEKLLNVIPADKIRDGIYCEMQKAIDDLLRKGLGQIPTADSVEPAPLAVGTKSHTSIMRFNKFSVPGPLLALHESQRKLAETGEGRPLELMINCTVTGLKKDDVGGVVRAIETNRGVLSWTDDDTKVVLCAGVSCLDTTPIIVVKKQDIDIHHRPSLIPRYFSTHSRSVAPQMAMLANA